MSTALQLNSLDPDCIESRVLTGIYTPRPLASERVDESRSSKPLKDTKKTRVGGLGSLSCWRVGVPGRSLKGQEGRKPPPRRPLTLQDAPKAYPRRIQDVPRLPKTPKATERHPQDTSNAQLLRVWKSKNLLRSMIFKIPLQNVDYTFVSGHS